MTLVRCPECGLSIHHPRPLKSLPMRDYGAFKGGGMVPCRNDSHKGSIAAMKRALGQRVYPQPPLTP